MSVTADTKTTLGAVVAVVTAFLSGMLWINTSIGAVEKSVTAVKEGTIETNHRLDLIDYRLKSLEGTADDRWRRSDMRAWVRDFKERNPTVSAPLVE